MGFDAVLAWTGSDDPATRRAKIRAFETVFLIGLASEAIHGALRFSNAPDGWLRPLLVVAFALVAQWERVRRVALCALLATSLAQIAGSFPLTANHVFLQLYILALFVVCDIERPEEQALFLDSARWLFWLVFFFAGVQKLVHGYYDHGEYFASNLSRESFASVWALITPTAEFERLSALTYTAGSGPFRFDSPLALALSNAAWATEIAIPVLLLFDRTRPLAVWGAVGFIIFTEWMARELHFGALFVAGILLYAPTPAIRRALPLFALFYAVLFAARIGWLPGITFY